MITFKLLLLLLIVCFFFTPVSTKYVSGRIQTTKQWVYLSNFCFKNEPLNTGYLIFTIWTHNTHAKLLFYNDTHNRLGGALDIINSNPVRVVIADGLHPHFWYLAVADCLNDELELDYQISFQNPGNFWYREFSFNQQELFPMYLVFFIFYALLVPIHLYNATILKRSNNYHVIMRMVLTSVCFEFFSTLLSLAHYAISVSYTHLTLPTKRIV
eukprot:TRINITY_DN10932_c0_g2_i6.p1 TRINITY_DN10932_c0_g2~~TRINITY_DN10932_c0_g2_i6.p1  ORF type:complete len:213 (-),score=6.97 TRINITY_DN10932_c0_g2_i6:8-646(-)